MLCKICKAFSNRKIRFYVYYDNKVKKLWLFSKLIDLIWGVWYNKKVNCFFYKVSPRAREGYDV